jgi:uncharacterized membrane protein YwzB
MAQRRPARASGPVVVVVAVVGAACWWALQMPMMETTRASRWARGGRALLLMVFVLLSGRRKGIGRR